MPSRLGLQLCKRRTESHYINFVVCAARSVIFFNRQRQKENPTSCDAGFSPSLLKWLCALITQVSIFRLLVTTRNGGFQC